MTWLRWAGLTARPHDTLIVLVAIMLVGVSAGGASAAPVKQVLLLQSMDRGNMSLDSFTADFRVDLDQRTGRPVNVSQVVVAPLGPVDVPEQAILEYVRAIYAHGSPPDLIVTIGSPAAVFARKVRGQLYPATPLLFAAVEERFLQDARLGENEAVVAGVTDVPRVIRDILQVFPDTSQLFMIIGSGAVARLWRPTIERDLQPFADRLTFTWSDTLSFDETLRHAASLPPHSVILYAAFGTDAQGGAYADDRVLADLHAAANAPVFGTYEGFLGHGVIGGSVQSLRELEHGAVDAAVRILDGEPAGDIRARYQTLGAPIFDGRELERWRVSDNRLPAGSLVRFREPGTWERYRWVIVAAASALLAQALLIGGLLLNRAQRRRAERSLRENVAHLDAARASLSHLSGRLMEAQEQERTRLARELHDDIGQQVSFVSMDVARLRDALPTAPAADVQEQARDLQEAVVALGRDLRGFSHRLHSSKIDLIGLSEAARSFCAEAAGRYALEIAYRDEQVPAELAGGVAISLFRVLQEAVSNAGKHAGATRCDVLLRGADGGLTLEVTDDGRGFDTQALHGQGLGLISMQERLKLVNGVVAIKSTIGLGTTVRATVPL